MNKQTNKKKAEHPILTGFRLMDHHRKAVKKLARKRKVSEAEIVRQAIEAFEYQNI